MAYFALVPAAGSGSRLGGGVPKQYLTLAGQPLIRHALGALAAVQRISVIFVVLAGDDAEWDRHDWAALGDRLRVLKCGGATRAASVANGLQAMAPHADAGDWVLVHDAARPCVTPGQINHLIDVVGDDAVGGLLAEPLADTLKQSDAESRSVATIPRDRLWRAQTPQMFRHGRLLEALRAAPDVTDEAGAIEGLGLKPRLVDTQGLNPKVTYADDMALAGLILKSRGR